ncbi:MAG: glycosyltransferase family 39 protein [Thermoleophilia bacterium]
MKSAVFKRFQLVILIGVLLAVTLPFIGQAVHHDAHQWVHFAKQGLEHPLWHHIPDYDYFGVNYPENSYHDTHPRLHSLYLSMWLAITGSLTEFVLHLEMLLFPLLAVMAMYFLAKRFGVNAFIATLLFILAPAFLVANHLIMIDVPGTTFWLLATAFYLKGVDDDRLVYLLAGALCLSLGVLTYYQDLSLLPLLFVYLLLSRRISPKTIIALSIPLVVFLAFSAAHYAYYDAPPRFTYNTVVQPMDLNSILVRIRGAITLVGGVIIFPLAALAVFSRQRWINLASAGVLVVASAWAAVNYFNGSYSADNVLLLPWLMAAGTAILLYFLRRFFNALPLTLVNAGGGDDVFLGLWFLGVFFYNSILLPYSSSRFILPLLAPVVIYATKEMDKLWGASRKRMKAGTAVVAALTLALSLGIAIGEHYRANIHPVEAEWALENYPPDGHVWFLGGLGFQYYMEQKGYKMAMVDGEGIQSGDYIIESRNNRWYFNKSFKSRLELVEEVVYPRRWPLVTEYLENRTSWLGRIGMVIPYGFQGDNLDILYIYRVAEPDRLSNSAVLRMAGISWPLSRNYP